MPKISKNTLLSYVIPYWVPVVQQIRDWMDSYFHKDEKIPIDSVEGLQEKINELPSQVSINNLLSTVGPVILNLSTSGSYNVPAGKAIVNFRFDSGADQTIYVQDTSGDLLGEQDVKANVPLLVGCGIAATNSAIKTVQITGITAELSIKIYLI